MPFVDVRCKDCNNVEEHYLLFREMTMKMPKCVACNSENTVRVYGTVAIVYPLGDLDFSISKKRFQEGLYFDDGPAMKKKTKDVNMNMKEENSKKAQKMREQDIMTMERAVRVDARDVKFKKKK